MYLFSCVDRPFMICASRVWDASVHFWSTRPSSCPRPLPGLVAPLATAGATLTLTRSDGAARLATRARLPPDLLNRAGWESRHVSRTSRRPLLTTGEATGAATAGKESGTAATREESRNRTSRKTRETAGKSYKSRLYFDCCRHDVKVL